ncbi:molybdate ABC transporter substrate-binding protein [Halobacillus shinanisalinarum]|uniref:Molybdate ABC transporter substrate-binding protein n=1 Tax=Halobacillus shinanisalinarum TaxID=2932258 RepID=A0ABY4H5H4_9BACI|nr:molybdate ABC transporter substrate-binding protein [Halobacillus shinanisalinarum]UOQ95554.1 molybdate ABC transporter substrate-binding protein [Halobacillus shinanisalinarum]
MHKKVMILITGLVLLFLVGCSDPSNEESSTKKLTISAASSLTDAMKEIKRSYESDHSDVSLTFNFAGSGKLAQQIQQGAPVDVFLSANQQWMDTLEQEQLIQEETRMNFTGNSIVLIANQDRDFNFNSFADIKLSGQEQLALGDPASVPAGMYTKEILQSVNKWDALKDQMVYARNVRQVLTYVESGNAALGMVYASDALLSDQIKVLAKAEPSMHRPIIYPAAITADSSAKEEAQKFLDYLKTEEAQNILQSYGFEK